MNSDGATIFFWNWIRDGLDSNFTKFIARLQVKGQLLLVKNIIVNENVFMVDYQFNKVDETAAFFYCQSILASTSLA